jgi:hypothetical protein
MTHFARLAALLGLVVLLTAGYCTESGRGISIAVVAVAILIALVRYGHEATTLYLAERHRALLCQTRES